MYRIIVVAAMLPCWWFVSGQTPAPKAKPALPHYTWNICPGEGCIYREWTARKAVMVLSTYQVGRLQIAQLHPGDKVSAFAGVVVTSRAGLIRIDDDMPDRGLKRGDTILTYADRGEGNSDVWLKGWLIPEFDTSFAKWPDGAGCQGESCRATYVDLGQKTWWAEVRLASGGIGWLDMDRSEMDGTCSLVHKVH